MKRAGLTTVMLFVAMAVFAQFQGFDWGTPRSEIEIAHDDFEEVQRGLLVNDSPWFYLFYFTDDERLARGVVGTDFEIRESVAAWQEFNDTKEILIRKYGRYVNDRLVWWDATTQYIKGVWEDDPLGSIERDFGYWQTDWEADDVLIELRFERAKNRSDLTMAAIYQSVELLDQYISDVQRAEEQRF